MTWHEQAAGMTLVEQDEERGTRCYMDAEGKRHWVMRADPAVLALHGPTILSCTHAGCEASVVIAVGHMEPAKGWQLHPALGWRCRTHPWQT